MGAQASRHPERSEGSQTARLRFFAVCAAQNDGGTLRFVACSNAYASSRSFGSLQAMPVKLTPYGVGLASKPAGNAGVGAFGTNANGTMTVGYPGLAAMPAPLAAGNSIASRRSAFITSSMPCVPP